MKKVTLRKQCTLVDLQECPNGIIEAYFRFNYGADENVLPETSKVQYWNDTYVTWRFNPSNEAPWVLPFVITCWKTESPITCVFDPMTGAVIGVALTFVPINYSEE